MGENVKKLFKSRKGDAVLDTISIMVILFVFAFVIFLTYKGFEEMSPDMISMLNDSSNPTSNMSVEIVQDVGTQFPSVFDGAILIIFIGLWIFSLVSAYFIDSHPIFFIFSVILLVFVLIAAMILNNVGEEMLADAELDLPVEHFPITNFLISHLFIVLLVVSFSVVFVLYGKRRMGA